MPYIVTTTTQRSSPTTLLYTDTLPPHHIPPAYNAPGFISWSCSISPNRLTIIDEWVWATPQDAMEWKMLDPRNMTPTFATAERTYNAANHITVTVGYTQR